MDEFVGNSNSKNQTDSSSEGLVGSSPILKNQVGSSPTSPDSNSPTFLISYDYGGPSEAYVGKFSKPYEVQLEDTGQSDADDAKLKWGTHKFMLPNPIYGNWDE